MVGERKQMVDINPGTGRQIDQGSYGQKKVMNCPKRKGQGWVDTGQAGAISLFDQLLLKTQKPFLN